MSNEVRNNLYKIVDNTRPAATQGMGSSTTTVRDRLMPFLSTPARIVRWVVYYLMMWLRPLVQWSTRAVAIPSAIIAVIAFAMEDGKRPNLPAIFMAVSFAAFLFGWFYDTAILAVAPEPVFLT